MTIPYEAVQAAARKDAEMSGRTFDALSSSEKKRYLVRSQEQLTAAAPFLQGVKVKDEGKLLMDVTQAIFPEGWTMSNRNAVADGIRIVLSAIEVGIPATEPSPRAQALEEAAKLCEKYAQSYQIGLCHYGSIDKDAGRCRQEGHINAGNELATAIRALSSQPVADTRPTGGSNHGE